MRPLAKPVIAVACAAGAAALGWSLWVTTERLRVEQPRYRLLGELGPLELRRYDAHIVASTEVTGDFEYARSEALWRLDGYISGRNVGAQQLSMTAPIEQQRRPPALQPRTAATHTGLERARETWRMTLSMPSAYGLEELPRPYDSRVELARVPGKTVAVLRFSGRVNAETTRERGDELMALVGAYGWKPVGEPVLAQYDGPGALPFLRRNELQVQVELGAVASS